MIYLPTPYVILYNSATILSLVLTHLPVHLVLTSYQSHHFSVIAFSVFDDILFSRDHTSHLCNLCDNSFSIFYFHLRGNLLAYFYEYIKIIFLQ